MTGHLAYEKERKNRHSIIHKGRITWPNKKKEKKSYNRQLLFNFINFSQCMHTIDIICNIVGFKSRDSISSKLV